MREEKEEDGGEMGRYVVFGRSFTMITAERQMKTLISS
jgi:hypothetical protein